MGHDYISHDHGYTDDTKHERGGWQTKSGRLMQLEDENEHLRGKLAQARAMHAAEVRRLREENQQLQGDVIVESVGRVAAQMSRDEQREWVIRQKPTIRMLAHIVFGDGEDV